MHRRISWPLLGAFMAALLVFAGISAPTAWGQAGTTGTVTVTVLDQSGGVVSGAQLELQDVSTNDIRNAVTQDRGIYTFVGLPIGTYKLTISKTGFETQVHDSVIVQAAQVTDVNVSLKVGAAAGEKVEVTESSTPLVDTTSNAIGTTIDMKQIEDLPLAGRNLSQLSTLVPGTANSQSGPTWNGLPVSAQGGNIDGVIGSTNRMKFAGNGAAPDTDPRIEDIAEMTVQTDQLDLNQGFGQSTMQLNFVTRRGTNSFHGRAFEDFQNSYLNANSWRNGAAGLAKNHTELNDFGGSLGGPILKNKLFFFGTYSEAKQPGSSTFTQNVLTPAAQAGVFTYSGGTVCLFSYQCPAGAGIVDQYNTANGKNFPVASAAGPANATVGLEQSNINSILNLGQLTPTGDPNIDVLSWESPNPTTVYYPTVRVDYNVSQNLRINFAWNMTKTDSPNAIAPQFPGQLYAPQGTGSTFKDYTAGLGIDWTLRPTLVNELRGGYLYHYDGFGAVGFGNIENQYPSVNWGVNAQSGQNYGLPTPDYYPIFNLADTMTWQHGAHTVNFGLTWYREQDHYWNAPAGFATYSLGLGTGDPALSMFTNSTVPGASGDELSEIQGLYGTLAGRISNVNVQNAYIPKSGQYSTGCNPCRAYDLDERSQAWGLFFQDSFRVKPSLTVNYGLRWDFTGANTDLTNAYTSVPGSQLYGPSGPGNLFNAGSLLGTLNPQYVANGQPYHPWKFLPQPTIGIAWSPQYSEGFLGKLLGGGQTVIRSGFSLRNFIQPYQYMWNYATDTGSFYYQSGQLNPGPPGAGFFQAGTLALGGGSPLGEGNAQLDTINQTTPLLYNPPTFTRNVPMSTYTFLNFNPDFPNSAWGFDPNIKLPYTESWNLGIQRQLGNGNALEIRYIGNRSVHQWMGVDTNEVNIFQNGMPGGSFLSQFQQAQANLALNNASANATNFPNYAGTFAYNPAVIGERDTPVFDAAFAGEPGPIASTDFGYSQFITDLQHGAAGAFASALTQPSGGQGDANFFCNLVGASFSPCATNVGFTGVGAGYPINYFQANPFETGGGTELMTSGGYSNYNGLQIDFRQKQWHGMQFDANYTWAHTLGLVTSNDWLGQLDNIYTLRDLKLNYAPTLYDIRHTVNISGTYDLPFGKGKRYLSSSGMLDRIVGGWTVGTILSLHTGSPFRLSGGYQTFNSTYLGSAGGGVVLNGVTPSQLQDAVGVYEQGSAIVPIINPQLLRSPKGGAVATMLYPNASAGTITAPVWLHGPLFWNDDMAVTKLVPIRENLRFSLQGEFLNAFNHPNFGTPSGSVQSSAFGTVTGPISGARAIELRANLEF